MGAAPDHSILVGGEVVRSSDLVCKFNWVTFVNRAPQAVHPSPAAAWLFRAVPNLDNALTTVGLFEVEMRADAAWAGVAY